jgi:hypothetical protein
MDPDYFDWRFEDSGEYYWYSKISFDINYKIYEEVVKVKKS